MASKSTRRALPPGIQDEVVFGIIWIRIGSLKLTRKSNVEHNVLLQFWGEPKPAILQTSPDLAYSSDKRLQQYDIKCPITYFGKYLEDMSNSLRFEIEGVGKVQFSIKSFLKPKLQMTSRQVFDHFKGSFEVIGKGKKVGTIEVQMASTFNPEIALRELGEDVLEDSQQIQKDCPCNHIDISECRCTETCCLCHQNKKNAIDVLAVQKPELLQEFYEQYRETSKKSKATVPAAKEDRRIPHSIDTTPVDNDQFDVNRYLEKESKQKSPSSPQKHEKSYQFPAFEKVLTYENLRLDYVSPKNQQQESRKIEKSSPSPKRQHQDPRAQKKEEILLPSTHKAEEKELYRDFYGQVSKKMDNVNLLAEDLSQVGKVEEEFSVDPVEKEVLSRVVNLQEELEKSRNKSSPKRQRPQKMETDNVPPSKFQSKQLQQPPAVLSQPVKPIRNQPSSLILNILIQIPTESVTLSSEFKRFTIAHKPYGQKDRVKIGPYFDEKITILCPVSEREILKMGQLPLILQFWTAVDNTFIGVIKINLLKIKKGFLLNGRLNQIAVKTNLMPTIVCKGIQQITDLNNKITGKCELYAGIGTSSQLDAYLNEKGRHSAQNYTSKPQKQIEIKKQKAQKQETEPVVSEENMETNGDSLSQLNYLLKYLDENNDKCLPNLITFMKKKEVPFQEFKQFLKLIGCPSAKSVFPLLQVSSSKSMQTKQLSDCFNTYKQISRFYFNDLIATAQKLKKQLTESHMNEIRQSASFNMIESTKLKAVLVSAVGNESLPQHFVGFFPTLIDLDHIFSSIGLSTGKKPLRLYTQSDNFIEAIQNYYLSLLTEKKISAETLLQIFGEKTTIDLQDFATLGGRVEPSRTSIWLCAHIFQIIKDYFDEKTENNYTSINFIYVYNWTQIKLKQFQELKSKNPPEIQVSENSQVAYPTKPDEKSITPQKKLDQSQLKGITNKNSIQNEKQDESVIGEPSKQEQSLVSPHEESAINKLIRHSFIIQPLELSLEVPYAGQCLVTYHFPYEEEPIKSKKISLFNDKHRYSISFSGTHRFTIQDSIENYLNDTPVRFTVSVNNKIELEGDLHPDELMTSGSKAEIKVVPLFADDIDKLAGKIKFKVEYCREKSQDTFLGKETVYNVYLPKSGYLNYSLTSTIDPNRIRHQLSISEQYYLVMVLDLFHESPNLKSHFPPVSSPLNAQLNDPMVLKGALKLALNPVILEHFKLKNALLSLNVVYYAKNRGSYERKEQVYATIRIPLIDVIKEHGISGQYAFKNKLGMFVALINCSFNYSKEIQQHGTQQESERQHRKQNYWIMFRFVELINFENENLNWAKFQFVYGGKKYSTEKIQLPHETYNDLKNEMVVLHLNEEEFNNLKVIPFTVGTNLSTKFNIDINAKIFPKKLAKDKYYSSGHYFILVDQHSQARKIRAGIKVYAFRGPIHLTNFLDSFERNRDKDVFSQLDLPKEINNYDQMLSLFRNDLKLSNKGFEDVLSLLLHNRKKQKLSYELFTNQIHYKIDLTPIFAFSETDIEAICSELDSQVASADLISYLNENQIKLTNFREEFLSRFSFRQLNHDMLDKNAEFLGLSEQIDLITFVRKIKIQGADDDGPQNEEEDEGVRDVKITVLRGYNFQYLYNGIKPNAMVKIPELGYQSKVLSRTGEPVINETIQEIVDRQNLPELRKLHVEIYHVTNTNEEIQIGQGAVSVIDSVLGPQIPCSKIYKVTLGSLMSVGRLKATLELKIQINFGNQQQIKEEPSDVDQSQDISRVGDIIRGIKHDMLARDQLFESSDDDY